MNEVPTLQTARCNLALLQPDNADLFFAYRERNLAHVAPWEPAPNPNDGTLEQACQRVAAKSAKGLTDGLSVHFIATDRETGAVVAGCNFTNIVRGIFQDCHLGYSVDHAWQGKGLMFEVAQAGVWARRGCPRLPEDQRPVARPRVECAGQ